MKFGSFVQSIQKNESGQGGAITLLVGTFAFIFLAALLTPSLFSAQLTAKSTTTSTGTVNRSLSVGDNSTVDASMTIYLVLPAMAGISVVVALFR